MAAASCQIYFPAFLFMDFLPCTGSRECAVSCPVLSLGSRGCSNQLTAPRGSTAPPCMSVKVFAILWGVVYIPLSLTIPPSICLGECHNSVAALGLRPLFRVKGIRKEGREGTFLLCILPLASSQIHAQSPRNFSFHDLQPPRSVGSL